MYQKSAQDSLHIQGRDGKQIRKKRHTWDNTVRMSGRYGAYRMNWLDIRAQEQRLTVQFGGASYAGCASGRTWICVSANVCMST